MARQHPFIVFAWATVLFVVAASLSLAVHGGTGGVALVWFANALLLGVALRSPRTALWPVLAATVAGTALTSVLWGRGLAPGLLSGAFNAMEIGLVHAVFQRMGWRRTTAFSDRNLLAFIGVAVLLAPAVSGLSLNAPTRRALNTPMSSTMPPRSARRASGRCAGPASVRRS